MKKLKPIASPVLCENETHVLVEHDLANVPESATTAIVKTSIFIGGFEYIGTIGIIDIPKSAHLTTVPIVGNFQKPTIGGQYLNLDVIWLEFLYGKDKKVATEVSRTFAALRGQSYPQSYPQGV